MTYNELVMTLIYETPNLGDATRIMWQAVIGEGYETQENMPETNHM